MPFLSIVRMAFAVTRRRTQRFSLSTQHRRACRLGRKRRLVLLFACETLLPTIGPLPVTWHTRAMDAPLWVVLVRGASGIGDRAFAARCCAAAGGRLAPGGGPPALPPSIWMGSARWPI